jgi:glycerophosphoryl diester phosphodiesterase
MSAEFASANNQNLVLIAHRGESADAPENTMAAFRLAYARHADAIELDVHLTKDDELLVCHDPDTERTTGTLAVIRESLLQDLRTLDAGAWKGPQWAGEKLPTLSEVLTTLPDGARCFIEIKVGPEAVPALERIVNQFGGKPEQLVIMSFEAATVAESKRRMPHITAYLLSSFERDKAVLAWTPTAQSLIDQTKSIRADGIGLHHEGPVNRSFVYHIKSAGLAVYVWTVDDVALARRLIQAGVDGITTNRAGWLREQLAED